MKIEIEEDWLSDAVRLKVDGKEIGNIYVESVNLVAEVIFNFAKTISPDSIIEVKK